MIKKLLYFYFVTLLFSCSSTKEYNQRITTKKHSVNELKADVDMAYQILKDGHPGLYWYTTKKQLDTKFDSLKNGLNEPLCTREFYKKLAPVIAAVKCGHTSLMYPSVVIKDKKVRDSLKKNVAALNQFSYSIADDNKLFIIKNRDTSSFLKPGTEVLAIEKNPIANWLKDFRSIVSTDGYNTTFIDKKVERNFGGYFKVFHPYQDSLLVKYKLPNDSIGEIFVKTYKTNKPADTAKKIASVKKSVASKTILTSYKKYRGAKENGEYQIDFKFTDDKKDYALMKIKTFASASADYNNFYKACFDSISVAKTNNLIIDLRDNGGGRLNASIGLFAYLTDKEFQYLDRPAAAGYFDADKYGSGFTKVMYFLTGHNDRDVVKFDKNGYYTRFTGNGVIKAKKNNFKGKVFVITNGYTFSAASLLSANLKGINRATFIGTETGGGFNQCTAGTLPEIALKNSKVVLRFGLYKISPKYQVEVDGRGVFPDVELASTIKDRVAGYDRELQWVLENNKKTQ